MKLLFVAKRAPQQRDLVSRPYGRFHYLPAALSRLGHDVSALLLDHRDALEPIVEHDGFRVETLSVRKRGLGTLGALAERARRESPDWIIGCSDAWYGWVAHRLARRVDARLAVDAYDNYEAYMPWNLPLHVAWRRSIAAAEVVTAAGPQLACRLDSHRSGRSPTTIVPMAADPMFGPYDRAAARIELGLPPDAPLIGYFGSWAANRGTDIVLEAFRLVREQRREARLVLTGRPPRHALEEPGVLALGYVDDAKLPVALPSLDVACVITTDSQFGRFSYPAKLCEAMACQVPVVATSTEPVRWMLRDDARFLAPIGDAQAIADRILTQLASARIIYPDLPTWETGSRIFEAALVKAQRD